MAKKSDSTCEHLVSQIADLLQRQSRSVVVAESLTGSHLAAALALITKLRTNE